MNVIAFKDVKKQFPKNGFTLDLQHLFIEEGYVTGLVGENGAGKSTTLKLLMGFLYADEGQIQVFGKPARDCGADLRAQIGYIGEETGYLDQAELRNLADMIKPFYPSWDNAYFNELMERFSLNPESRHKTLSKGQKKQFAIAMALSHHPRLLLLDEPTANLDPLVRDEILDLLFEKLEKEGITICFSTHITSDLDKIADRLLFLHKGKLFLEGDKDELLDGHAIVKGSEALLQKADGLLIGVEQNAFGFRALTAQAEKVRTLCGGEVIFEKPRIEDLFLSYMKQERRNQE